MINQIITYLLDKLIGKYVDNFTSSNVKTGLFQGDLRLENLPLKKAVLEDLTDFPVTVKSGLVGRVTLRIPYTQLRTQAWAIMLEDIYIVAGPNFKRQISHEKEVEDETVVRKLILDSLETKWRRSINMHLESLKAGENDGWLSSVASFGYRVLRNIQVEVRNVHIRYEDDETAPGRTFALGLVVDEFSTKSSDFEWDSKQELKVDASVVQKVLDLKSIRIYLDPVCVEGSCENISSDNIKSVLDQKLLQIPDSSYIMMPISIHGTMKRHLTPLPIFDQPRILLQLKMELLELSLTQMQYRTSIELLNELDRYERQKQHIKTRPSFSIAESPRLWWQFAIRENMPNVCKGEELMKRARDLVTYVQTYETHLLDKNNDGISFCNELDSELEIDLVIELREIAMERAKRRSREMMTETVGKVAVPQKGWWGYLWGSKTNEIPSPIPETVTPETTQILEKVFPGGANYGVLEQDISDILNEIDHDATNFFTKDKIFLRGQFSLSGIRIRLLKDINEPILGVQADNLSVGFESRPSYSSWSINVTLRSLLMQDLGVNRLESPFVDVVSCVNNKNEDKEIFMLAFEKNPLQGTCLVGIKKRLAITSEPLTIVHCPLLIANVQKYFGSIRSNKNIRAAARRHIRYAKIRTSASLKEMIEKESAVDKWHIFLKISAPKLVVPNFNKLCNFDTNCVVLDLGRLQVSNCNEKDLDSLLYNGERVKIVHGDGDDSDIDEEAFVTPCSSPLGSLEDLSIDTVKDDISLKGEIDTVYEEYSIVLDNIMVLIGSWKELKSILTKRFVRKRCDIMLMEPFKLQLSLKRKYLPDNNHTHPNIVLETAISRLLVNMSDSKIHMVKGCLNSLTKSMLASKKNNIKEKRQRYSYRRYSQIFNSSNVATNNEKQLLSATFMLRVLIIQLETDSRPLVELTLTEAQFNMIQYRSKTCANLRLMSMILADARANLGPDLDFIFASHKGVYLDSSAGSRNVKDPLIVMSYERIGALGSENSRHFISVIFSGLDMIANQETFIELLSFSKQIMIGDDSSSLVAKGKEDVKTTKTMEYFNLSVTCQSVSVLFINILDDEISGDRSTLRIGTISMTDMKVDLVLEHSDLFSNVSIRGINIHDLSTADSLHNSILSLTTGSIDQVGISTSVSEDHIKIIIKREASSPFSITGTMPHIIYVHSPQFIHSVEHCIADFQVYLTRLKDNIAAAARTAILSSPEHKQNFQIFKNSRVHFEMLSPILVLPRHKTSAEVIIVHLGDIDVFNDDVNMCLVFTDATVISRKLPIFEGICDVSTCTNTENGFFLLKKTNLSLKICSICSSTDDSFNGIDVDAEFSSSLSISLSKDVYEQVLNSLDNIVYDDEEDIDFTLIQDASLRNEASDSDSQELPIRLHTNISELKVELYPDTFVICEDPMLRLTLKDISIEFIRRNKFIKDIIVEIEFISLYQILDSTQNKLFQPLLYSTHSHYTDIVRDVSNSCPDLTTTDNCFSHFDFMTTSLPRESCHSNASAPRRKASRSNSEDVTNDPSYVTRSALCEENLKKEKLIQIRVQLVDRKIPDFSSAYESVNRFINATFTDLTCRITTDIWVILLDFFGLGSKFFDPMDIKDLTDVTKVLTSFNRRYDGQIEEIINKKLIVEMKKFNIILENEIKYPNFENLAAITLTNLCLKVDSRDGNLNLLGSLEDFHLEDLSPTGTIYLNRLFAASKQQHLLEFEVFKYGVPDPSLLREDDMQVSVKIHSPIVYVHTQRFLQELNQFVQNFFQYQDRLSHMRVTSAGRIVDKMAPRSSRIRMKVSCQAPLLLIPVSVFSDFILVVDLGHFSLHNEFKFATNELNPCLLDEMCIDLHDMDLYSATNVLDKPLSTDIVFPGMSIRPILPKPLSKKCNLHLTVSRNLDSNISHSSPDWLLNGALSSVICDLNVDQYKTIKGVLSHNFGENTDHLQRFRFQAFQVDPTLHTNLTGVVWLGMKIEVFLNDVQVNLLTADSVTLCRMNFLQSKLSYESFSDSSKTIQLECQEIIVEDLRYQEFAVNNRPSVFPVILSRDNSDYNDKDQSSCQLKVQYTSSKDINEFGIFLNKMKIITIFDWIKAYQTWIFTLPYEIISLSETNEKRFDELAKLYVQSLPDSKAVHLPPIAIREQYREIVKEGFKSTTITFEVEESRFFILEKANQSHTNALILSVAGSFSYHTRECRLGPFTFNIPKLHLASCSMASNNSNLLSIVNRVKINVQTREKFSDAKAEPSLANVLQDLNSSKLLVDVYVSPIKVRLSFCDLQLLSTILQSLPRQTTPPANVAHQIGSIRYKWSSMSASEPIESQSSNQPLQRLSKFVESVSFKHLDQHDFISICLIDDCIDADVPLFDIKLNNLLIYWRLGVIQEATMNTSLSLDYYNINSFGWTPIIEPWPLRFSWKFTDMIELQLKSEEILNIDVSSHLLQIARNTHAKWSTELALDSSNPELARRDRTPFVPFVIVNELGCPIKYAKLAIDKPPLYDEALNSSEVSKPEPWILVSDSTPHTLCFDREVTARDKIRYDRYGMHFNSSHRIELAVEGFKKCHPITVDKLGVFYRDMLINDDMNWLNNRIRIVIDIVRQGSVQNKIIIRSSLQFQNALNIPIEIRLHKDSLDSEQIIRIDPNLKVPIPLFSVFHHVQVRPLSPELTPSSPTTSNCLYNFPVDFSENLISWQVVLSNVKVDKEILCPTSRALFYSEKVSPAVYLISTVKRLDFPINSNGLPGHVIIISAPLCIENLMPCDLKFDISLESYEDARNKVTNSGVVQASKDCMVLTLNMRNTIQLSVEFDNYPKCKKLTIPGFAKLSHIVLMCLYDQEDRMLELQVRVESRPSGPVHVTIFASYWIINRTSLSLVYAQAGNLNHLAAGQSLENETASSPVPFPFSFSNNDTYQFVIRLGSKSKSSNGDQLRPNWSPKLSLDKLGTATIQLKAALPEVSRPHLQYNVGLEIRPGKGKHRGTTMVILTSRYLLDNKSSYALNITQYKFGNKSDQDMSITVLPKSMLSFHWPREDLDPLLSVQLLDANKDCMSHWCGGFRIDQTSSFHIYLRGLHDFPAAQLRVTVTLQGARFRVVFTDTDGLPPPYLLQNLTKLQLFFSQIVPENSSTRYTLLAPNANIPYALDEPTLAANVTLSLEGGTHSTYNLNTIGPAPSLHYENFMYIVVQSVEESYDEPLVFDVTPQNRRVFLSTKKPGSRSQLWYYTSNHELFHEGSIAPHDPKQKIDRSAENHYLLDVDLIAPTQSTNNKQRYQMKLSRADHRRDKFQRWHFTEDGCLTNNLGMKCRVLSLCQNASVFSTFNPVEMTYPVMAYQDWLRPGSGIVNVLIMTDGPTRVLRIYDEKDVDKYSKSRSTIVEKENSSLSKLEITLKLKEVGVFLINHTPEELLYAVFTDIELEWTRQAFKDHLEMHIRTIQFDNQLLDTGFPCLVYQSIPFHTKDSLERSAFSIRYDRELGHLFDVHVFNNIHIHLASLNIILEEKLLLKVIQMLSPRSVVTKIEEEEAFGNLFTNYTDFHEGKKIYIGNLRVLTGAMSLSVITADSLPSDLKQIKKLIPYLMSFANAQIPMEPYDREHVFETSSLIVQSLANHYKNQLRSQAIKIFGTVDFLGNPIGFISDITSGMKRLYSDQNVSDMIKHFAHGIGDSTAKICNSASRVVYGMTLDPEYHEKRQALLNEARVSTSSTAHVKAGFRSFLNGLVGGAMSVPQQTWKGYQDDGSTGLFSGALKGIVGVVTKPVGGILDLATGSAASFREMARSSREGQPNRRYEPRCLSSSWKLLPFYSSYSNNLRHAVVLSDLEKAQILLAKFSKQCSPLENVVGLLVIQNSPESQMKILVSDSAVHIINTVPGDSHRIKHYKLSQLRCPPVCITTKLSGINNDKNVYLNFNCTFPTEAQQPTPTKTSGPLFKCDCGQVAKQVVKLVCEAQCDYLERQMTLTTST